MKDYKKILEGVVNIINTTEKSDIGFANICTYIGENCPELKESEDEKIRKALICGMYAIKEQHKTCFASIPIDNAIAWLEKQGDYHKGFRDDYNSGIHEEKPLKWTKHDELVRKEAISCLKHWKNCIPTTWNEDYKNILMWLENELSVHTEKQSDKSQGKTALEAIKEERVDNVNKVAPKFKVKYAGNEYNVFETKDIAGVTYYGIEDEPNHIDYVLPDNCEIVSEQKLADKVEPKFHKGEWLCENEPNNYARFIQILETVNIQGKERYRVSRDIHNDEDIVEFNFVEKYYHKFDVTDAKDGDVLYSPKGAGVEGIFLIKGWEQVECTGKTLCSSIGYRVEEDEIVVSELGAIWWEGVVDLFYPATKEQRDLLFQKIKEAGYKWDEIKKELKKIEQKCVVNVKTFDKYKGLTDFEGTLADICFTRISEEEPNWKQFIKDNANILLRIAFKQFNSSQNDSFEQNSTWNVEYNSKIQRICKYLDEAKKYYADITEVNECIDWLRSFLKKEYIPQSKQEWSEEDENRFTNLISLVKCSKENNATKAGFIEFINKLKSLKDRVGCEANYTTTKEWKPSDEQIKILEHFVRGIGENGYASPYDNNTKLLYLLLSDLKKLREE